MTGSRAPLRLGGVPDTSSDRGFWVTQAGALPGPPCQERMPIRVKGGVFLLPVLVVVFEGVLKLFLLFFGFGSLLCPRMRFYLYIGIEIFVGFVWADECKRRMHRMQTFLG